MASTVNFTGSVDGDLLKRAKVIAAKTDTSVNTLLNAVLRHLVENFEAAESTGNQNFKVLLEPDSITHNMVNQLNAVPSDQTGPSEI
jgi:hypothetical protein